MSTSNILFLKIGFGEAAGTVSPKHRPAEGIRAWRCGDSSFCPSLATVQDCLNISAAVNQIHTEPPSLQNMSLCVVQEKENLGDTDLLQRIAPKSQK